MYTTTEIFEMVNEKVDYEEIIAVQYRNKFISGDDYESLSFVVYALEELGVERAIESFDRMDTFLREVLADIIIENK